MNASTRITSAAALLAILASAAVARGEEQEPAAEFEDSAAAQELASQAPVPTKVNGVEDFDSWYLGFHLLLGGAVPLGDAHFAARAGNEFPGSFALHTGLDLDYGAHLQFGFRASALIGSPNHRAYGEGYSLAGAFNEGSGVGRYAVLQVRVYPTSVGFFRPYVGVGGGYANAEVKATRTEEVCSSGSPILGGGGCASVVKPLIESRYDGLTAVFAAGIRFDVPLRGASKRKKHPAGTLVPLYLEASYSKNFWLNAAATVATETQGPDPEVTTHKYAFDAPELDLDHLIITAGAGVMW